MSLLPSTKAFLVHLPIYTEPQTRTAVEYRLQNTEYNTVTSLEGHGPKMLSTWD